MDGIRTRNSRKWFLGALAVIVVPMAGGCVGAVSPHEGDPVEMEPAELADVLRRVGIAQYRVDESIDEIRSLLARVGGARIYFGLNAGEGRLSEAVVAHRAADGTLHVSIRDAANGSLSVFSYSLTDAAFRQELVATGSGRTFAATLKHPNPPQAVVSSEVRTMLAQLDERADEQITVALARADTSAMGGR